MLKQRILTALVLLAVMLPALFVRPLWPFAVLSLLGFGAAGWEWSRLNGLPGAAIALGIGLSAACGAALLSGWASAAPALVWWLAAFVWIIGGLLVLRGGVTAWPRWPVLLRGMVGLVLLWTAWLALVNAKSIGINFILSVFCVVWTADIAAYFGGRAWGRRKLAPAISPGKSWEGVWSGIAGALLLAMAWLVAERSLSPDSPSLFAVLDSRLGVFGLAVAIVFLVLTSVGGDLVESLVKRSAGAKDSSTLLPGHGGVLDRIDALLPVFPIALAFAAASAAWR